MGDRCFQENKGMLLDALIHLSERHESIYQSRQTVKTWAIRRDAKSRRAFLDALALLAATDQEYK